VAPPCRHSGVKPLISPDHHALPVSRRAICKYGRLLGEGQQISWHLAARAKKSGSRLRGHAVQEGSKNTSKGAHNSSHCPGNERCAVEAALGLWPRNLGVLHKRICSFCSLKCLNYCSIRLFLHHAFRHSQVFENVLQLVSLGDNELLYAAENLLALG
jgi:hypothetical protein